MSVAERLDALLAEFDRRDREAAIDRLTEIAHGYYDDVRGLDKLYGKYGILLEDTISEIDRLADWLAEAAEPNAEPTKTAIALQNALHVLEHLLHVSEADDLVGHEINDLAERLAWDERNGAACRHTT